MTTTLTRPMALVTGASHDLNMLVHRLEVRPLSPKRPRASF